jgi:hypothetical protein
MPDREHPDVALLHQATNQHYGTSKKTQCISGYDPHKHRFHRGDAKIAEKFSNKTIKFFAFFAFFAPLR